MTVNVRNQIQNDAVHAWVGRRRAAGQPGQLSAVRRRQVPPGHPDLLFDQVEIIQQPLGSRRVPTLTFGRFRYEPIRLDKNALVFIQPGKKIVGPRPAARRWDAASVLACRSSCSTLNNSDLSGGSSLCGCSLPFSVRCQEISRPSLSAMTVICAGAFLIAAFQSNHGYHRWDGSIRFRLIGAARGRGLRPITSSFRETKVPGPE